jgi:hypothetical protein
MARGPEAFIPSRGFDGAVVKYETGRRVEDGDITVCAQELLPQINTDEHR